MNAPHGQSVSASTIAGRLALLFGTLGVAGLASFGRSDLALLALAAIGAASLVLFGAGILGLAGSSTLLAERGLKAFAASPEAIALATPKGRVLWASDAFSKLFANDFEKHPDFTRIGEGKPEIASAIFRLIGAARRGQAAQETIHLPGEKGATAITLCGRPWSEGARRSALLLLRADVASGANANDRLALETIPMPALTVTSGMIIAEANRAFLAYFVGSNADIRRIPLSRLIRMQSGEPLTSAAWRELAQAGRPMRVQVHAAGERIPAFACFGGSAAMRVLLVLPANFTGSGEQARSALAQSPFPVAIASPDGIIHTASEAFLALISEAAGEESAAPRLPRPVASLVAEETSASALSVALGRFSEKTNPRPAPYEIQIVLKGAASKSQRLVFSQAADGELFILALEPLSPTAIDEQAAQGHKMQAVGELAGRIAHDFNNLLQAIMGNADLLLGRFRASDAAFEDVISIKNNANRAAELVRQILAYSRRQTLRPAMLLLTDIIEDFNSNIGRLLGEKVKARIEHGRDLWFVKADEGQIFQVVMNLAVNARDAMPNGGELLIRTANITERASQEFQDRGIERGEYVMCEVKDRGTGIAPEHLKRIFDPFFSTKEVGKGTGLGLSTVYGIVKQTGGTILVDSKVGEGTSFRIFLPRYVETEEDLRAREGKGAASDTSADLTGSSTVLLVEDEDGVRSFARRALSSRGYTVLEASTGAEALEVMDRANDKIDLVVSDVVMPEMDGPTLLRHLRKRKPDIKIVFMSGYAEEAFRKNLEDDEDFIFLPKPFTLKTLAETVKKAAA